MKRHVATFTFIGALVAALAFAQSTSDVVEVSRDDIQTGRKEILSNTTAPPGRSPTSARAAT